MNFAYSPDRNYAMTRNQAHYMVHRAWLYIVNNDAITGIWSQETRRILGEAGSRVLYEDLAPATSDEVAVLRAVASAEGVTI